MNSSFLEQIGARVQYLRYRKKLTVKRLAWYCEVEASVIHSIESGAYKAPYSLYEDICRVMGYTTGDLFGGFHWTYEPPKIRERKAS